MLLFGDDDTMLLFLLSIIVIALLELFKRRTERHPPHERDLPPVFSSTITSPAEDNADNNSTENSSRGEESDSLRPQPDGVSLDSTLEFSDQDDSHSLDGRSGNKLRKAPTFSCQQTRKPLMKTWSLRSFRDSGFGSDTNLSTSSLTDLNILADANPAHLGIHTFSAFETIGPQGGTVAVAGCTMLVPANALDHEENIEMKCYYNVPSDGENICITPTIYLGPSGLEFKKEVIIMLPTCYQSLNTVDLVEVTIQVSEGEEWSRHCVEKNSFPRIIVFKTAHFSWFRALVGHIFQSKLVKMIRYAGYIKRFNLQDPPLTHTLVWCFFDNLDPFVSQIDNEMNESYEKVILSETFPLKHLQNLKVVNKCENSSVSVNPISSVIRNNDLWLPGSIRKLQFRITRDSSSAMPDTVDMNFILTSGRGPVKQADYTRNGNCSFAWQDPKKPPPAPVNIYRPYIDTMIVS